jgi:ADP-ribosylglycohydrolase
VGLATVRACLRILLGFRRSGVGSAGNGAAMRAAVLGAAIENPAERRDLGRALAEVTHTDPRAVEAALHSAELVAAGPEAARAVVTDPLLGAALDRAAALAAGGTDVGAAARELGTSGYAVHTEAFALFCYLRFGGHPMEALQACIGAGGDTDSIAAILGAWLGARDGEAGLPADLLDRIHDGPFGPTHLRGLAKALATGGPPPGWSWIGALARNLALYPVVLAHGFRRLLP